MKKMLLVVSTVMAFTAPVMSADVDFYGSIEIGAWWDKHTRWYDDTNMVDLTDTTLIMGKDENPQFQNTWIPHGNFGFKVGGERIGGGLEIGVAKSAYEARLCGSTTRHYLIQRYNMIIYPRKWFAKWNINDFMTLLLGKDYSLTCFSICNQAYMNRNMLLNLGCLYTGSHTMVKFSMGGEIGSFIKLNGGIAAIKIDTVTVPIENKNLATDSETKIPKFEGSFSGAFEKDIFSFDLKAAGGFQRYEAVYRDENVFIGHRVVREPIDAFTFGTEGNLKVGPVSIGGTFSLAKNPGNYGVWVDLPWLWRSGSTDPIKQQVKDVFYAYHEEIPADSCWKIRNSKLKQFAVILRGKPFDFLALEGGFGFQTVDHEYDYFNNLWHDRYAWYFQTEVTFIECLTITPEIGQFIMGPDDKNGGRYIYWGFMSRFEF